VSDVCVCTEESQMFAQDRTVSSSSYFCTDFLSAYLQNPISPPFFFTRSSVIVETTPRASLILTSENQMLPHWSFRYPIFWLVVWERVLFWSELSWEQRVHLYCFGSGRCWVQEAPMSQHQHCRLPHACPQGYSAFWSGLKLLFSDIYTLRSYGLSFAEISKKVCSWSPCWRKWKLRSST
jgi:hypothetical protein